MAYLGSNVVKVNLDLQGRDAQKLSYRILNHRGEELLAQTEYEDVSGQASYEIVVPAELNILDAGNQLEIRLIEAYIESSVGVTKMEESYSIESETVLVTGENSFQTYPEALMTALTIPNLEYWDNADKGQRVIAMIASRRIFGRLRFRYNFDSQDHLCDDSVNVSDITLLTPEQFNALPSGFKEALKRAQILEADSMLDSSSEFQEIRKLAELGVTRSEVYEAKVSLGSGTTPYKTTLCDRAMQELTKWLVFRKRLVRTA